MHKLHFSLLLATSFCFSQTLSIEPGNSVNINSNSSITVDGLELSPSVTYTLEGPNSIARSSIPVVVGDNSSIERVYELSNELTDYSRTSHSLYFYSLFVIVSKNKNYFL